MDSGLYPYLLAEKWPSISLAFLKVPNKERVSLLLKLNRFQHVEIKIDLPERMDSRLAIIKNSMFYEATSSFKRKDFRYAGTFFMAHPIKLEFMK